MRRHRSAFEEELKVNLGAGRERFKGWRSLDLPPEANVSFEAAEGDVTLTPDIVSELPRIPLGSGSVSVFRSKDLLMDYHAEGYSISRLGREVRRVLRKGGRMITIEVPGFERALSPHLRVVSVVPGALIPYMQEEEPGSRFFVTVYVKD